MNKCPRTLDKPMILFGLEIEDIGVLSLFMGITAVLFNPVIPTFLFFFGWWILSKVKKGQPAGIIPHMLYKCGLMLPGLIPSPRLKPRYCVYSKADPKKILY